MKLLLACIVVSTPGVALPAETVHAWRWYYSAHGSPASDAKLIVRTGVANVVIDGASLRIDLAEAAPSADEKSTFVGKLAGARVSGKLINFFPSGDEIRQGEYREKQIANCKWQQISILPEYPDASVLIISRVEGACQ